MMTVVQPVRGGPVEVIEVPRPVAGPTEVLVATVASVISPGTERAVTTLAQSSLLAKAKARPDLVRQVVAKARSEGLASTAQAVRSRLGRRVLALADAGADTTARMRDWSRGRGADDVLICAATPSSGPAQRAPDLCSVRTRGTRPPRPRSARPLPAVPRRRPS